MTRFAPVIAASLALSVAAVVHGLRTDRWGAAADLRAAAAKLENFPDRIGDWEGRDLPLDPRAIEIAEIQSHVSRSYVNRLTGEQATMLLICGRPGPVAVHTPDVCYRGAGFVPGAVDRVPLAGDESAWTAEFTKPGAVPETLRIYWAWNATGTCEASSEPRKYAFAPALYKLYVITQVPPGGRSPRDAPPQATAGQPAAPSSDPAREFLNALLPVLKKRLPSASS